jgi:hypothetical protein
MDERHARFSAGSEGDRSTHRVGLTRHCLASGLVQLPFALRNALPEGALLAHDVERDAEIDLTFLPPRQLTGLADFFAAHELRVNDEIEVRLAAGEPPELRLLPVRRPRAADREATRPEATGNAPAEEAQPTRTASVWRSWREDGPSEPNVAATANDLDGSASLGTDPEVVDRFGSVTVRRLGTGRFGQAPTSVLAGSTRTTDADTAETSGSAPDATTAGAGTAPEVVPSAPVGAREPLEERPERLLGIDPDRRDAVELWDDVARGDDGGDFDEALLLGDPELTADATEPTVGPIQPPAGQSPSDATTDGAGGVQQASLFERPAAARPTAQPASDPRHGRPHARPARAQAPRARDREATSLRSPSEQSPSPSSVDAAAPVAADAATAQRAREEALSRAGDLRSRIVRWMLAPSTPMIVSVEAVQAAFDLPADVARDIVEGILDSPPPSLRLTRLRADQLRVSKITVEHDV